MPPVMIPVPVTDLQRHALTLFIKKKRAHYEKKDNYLNRKYKWLEDHNQRDPDLDGIEISEASLQELKRKRENLCEEKHRLFDKLKNLLSPSEEEDSTGLQTNEMGFPTAQTPTAVSGGYQGTFGDFHPTSYSSSTPYSVITEPVTPKKPSEMSPVQADRLITKPTDMSPVSSHERAYGRKWDNISPVNKSAEDVKYTPGEFPATTPATAKYADTRENRIDSFTKALTDTISKAMLSELNMTLENASKSEGTDKADKGEPVETLKSPAYKQSIEPAKMDIIMSPKPKIRDSLDKKHEPGPKTPDICRKQEPKTPDMSRKHESSHPEPSRKQEPKTPDRRNEGRTGDAKKYSEHGRSRKSESNSSISSKQQPHSPHSKKKEEVSDLPPVIKISKAEIDSKVMSWPTSYSNQRKAGDKTPEVDKKVAGKKESADSSGSSLLEFAFQSALFGNSLFNEKEGQQSQEPKTPPQSTSSSSTLATGPSDLLAALSLSYGGGPSKKHEKNSEKIQEKSRKRERSPEARSPSPELVQVYKTEEKAEEKIEEEKEVEKKKVLPPPPPPPPPPKSSLNTPAKKAVTSPWVYAPQSPQSPAVVHPHVSYSSYHHNPLSFLSPTHSSQFSAPQFSSPSPRQSPHPHKSPGSLRSPYYGNPAYPAPHSPRIGMLAPQLMQPPMAGLAPHMPPLPPPPHVLHPPPPHVLHPPHKIRNYPPNRFM